MLWLDSTQYMTSCDVISRWMLQSEGQAYSKSRQIISVTVGSLSHILGRWTDKNNKIDQYRQPILMLKLLKAVDYNHWDKILC